MYYVIMDIKTQKVIYTNESPLPEDLKAKDVYSKFDSKTMEFMSLSLHDKVEGGYILPKTDGDLVAEGVYTLNVPFEYIDENNIQQERTVEEALNQNLIRTEEECNEAFRIVGARIESDIKKKYTRGYELKLMRKYLLWMADGKPSNDKREKNFFNFSKDIDKIKNKYKEVMTELKKVMANISK